MQKGPEEYLKIILLLLNEAENNVIMFHSIAQ